MKNAIRKLVVTSAANNEKLVIADKDGKIITASAKEVLNSVL
jgi:hypothetical protein